MGLGLGVSGTVKIKEIRQVIRDEEKWHWGNRGLSKKGEEWEKGFLAALKYLKRLFKSVNQAK